MTDQKKPEMSAFHSRSKANEGVKHFLAFPDGTLSDEFVVIRGMDSDAFRTAQDSSNFDLMIQIRKEQEALIADPKSQPSKEFRALNKLKLISALVSDWSFEKECSQENVQEFLKESPHICDAVDRLASDRKRFFNKPSADS
jgi:hypothetical protein